MMDEFEWAYGVPTGVEVVTEENIYVGLRVTISKYSEWYGSGISNPKDIGGTVDDTAGEYLPITVEWDNGKNNEYNYIDLDTI